MTRRPNWPNGATDARSSRSANWNPQRATLRRALGRGTRTFVDQPGPAVAEADELVSEVMRERGYPVSEDFEQRAADVSVDHPVVVEHYRAAHGISVRAPQGDAGTEDLRQAMVHFRALFDELLGRDERVTTSNPNHERTT